jgi:hypothetical protein
MYHGTVSGDDLLFKDEEARIKAVINGLETKLKIKRGEPPSKNKTIEIKKLEERIYILNAQVEGIRRQNKRKTNRRTALPKPEKSEPEPEPEYVSDEQTTESDYEVYDADEEEDKKEKGKKEKDKKKSQGSCCGSRPSGKLKKTRKKRKRKQTKKRKKKKQTRKYKKLR